MTVIGLICLIVFLGVVAYVVECMKLPAPYGRIAQLVLLILLIVGIGKFALAQGMAF